MEWMPMRWLVSWENGGESRFAFVLTSALVISRRSDAAARWHTAGQAGRWWRRRTQQKKAHRVQLNSICIHNLIPKIILLLHKNIKHTKQIFPLRHAAHFTVSGVSLIYCIVCFHQRQERQVKTPPRTLLDEFFFGRCWTLAMAHVDNNYYA